MLVLTQLHTKTGRSRCEGRWQRSLCALLHQGPWLDTMYTTCPHCVKRGVFTRLYDLCFPNNKTAYEKQGMHTQCSRDKTVQVKKLQVHCVLKFSTRACAEWAWTDGLCFQLRYGRVVNRTGTTTSQACEATMAHYDTLLPEMLGISSSILATLSGCSGSCLEAIQALLTKVAPWISARCTQWKQIHEKLLSVLAPFPGFRLLDFRYWCRFVHDHGNDNTKPTGCLIQANVQIEAKWSALVPLKTHIFSDSYAQCMIIMLL